MAIIYHRQSDYAARPRAPRRRGHQPAVRDDQPGQVSMFQMARTRTREQAMTLPCPACHAPKGAPCTRRPVFGEGTGPVALGYTCHVERLDLIDDVEDGRTDDAP